MGYAPQLPIIVLEFELQMRKLTFVFVVIIYALFLPACSKEFVATVISVTDGDTLVVQHDATHKKIRLYGIDCPEGNQKFGNEARRFTTELVGAKSVRIEPLYNDPKERIVAKVYLPDNRYVNGEIVAAGYAWWFRKYAQDDDLLEKLEREARTAHRGLWNDPKPTEPWLFRQ